MTLEDAENKIWKLFFDWQDTEWPNDFEVVYEKSFDLRDKHADLELYRKTLEVVSPRGLPDFESKIMEQVAELVLDNDEDIQEVKNEIEAKEYAAGTEAAEVRTYPDGEPIPAALPEAYQPASNAEVPGGENCANCAAYDANTMKCSIWANAVVRPNYWCAKWAPVE
jgi:hypothetical protein